LSGIDRSVDDALTDDHVRLDGLFRTLRRSVENRDPRTEAVRSEFERRLLRHMTWEEETLFPALRAADGRYPAKKIESLVIDHDRIREGLRELASELVALEWTGANQSVEDLWVLLEGHNRDEEKGVYTDADRLIPEAERQVLLARWRAS